MLLSLSYDDMMIIMRENRDNHDRFINLTLHN